MGQNCGVTSYKDAKYMRLISKVQVIFKIEVLNEQIFLGAVMLFTNFKAFLVNKVPTTTVII